MRSMPNPNKGNAQRIHVRALHRAKRQRRKRNKTNSPQRKQKNDVTPEKRNMTSMVNKQRKRQAQYELEGKPKQRKRTDDARSRSTSRICMVDLCFFALCTGD